MLGGLLLEAAPPGDGFPGAHVPEWAIDRHLIHAHARALGGEQHGAFSKVYGSRWCSGIGGSG